MYYVIISVVLVQKMPFSYSYSFPAGALRAPAGPKIVSVPRDLCLYVCLHLEDIMLFIHVVLEECTP